MQTGQVSAWVPIIVGVLGIAGVIAGQLINARRERVREDVRWERERQREEVQRKHDMLVHWREARSDAYSNAYLALSGWYTVVMFPDADGSFKPGDQERMGAYQVEALNALARLSLFATSEVIEKAGEVQGGLYALQFRSPGDFNRQEYIRKAGAIQPSFAALLNSMRGDLGVDRLERGHIAVTIEAITPSRPSAPTS